MLILIRHFSIWRNGSQIYPLNIKCILFLFKKYKDIQNNIHTVLAERPGSSARQVRIVGIILSLVEVPEHPAWWVSKLALSVSTSPTTPWTSVLSRPSVRISWSCKSKVIVTVGLRIVVRVAGRSPSLPQRPTAHTSELAWERLI